MDPLQELHSILSRAKSLPVIFVGSGLSRRYYGLPDWDGLLAHFASLTGRSLPYYRSKTSAPTPDQPSIASLISSDFIDLWWSDSRFASSRSGYDDSTRSKLYPLKIEIAKFIASHPRTDSPELLEELTKLAQARVHAIVTTNWDTLLEELFPNFPVYIGQDEVIFQNTFEIAEIYKIHGSISEPPSLVLTQEDYESFERRNAYLVAKLLMLFTEHPVIFFGYSLSDPHIQLLLSELAFCIPSNHLSILEDRMIFVKRPHMPAPDSLTTEIYSVGNQLIPARVITTSDFGAVFDILSLLHEHYPVQLLRRLRRDVYQLAYDTKPSSSIYVADIDDDTDLDKVETVIGVGSIGALASIGYTAMDRQKLVDFMLRGEMSHDPDRLLNDAVPRIFKGPKYAPIYYPMFIASKLDENGNPVENLANCPNGQAILDGKTTLKPYLTADREQYRNEQFIDLVPKGSRIAAGYGVICKFDVEDIISLRDFLRLHNEHELPGDSYWKLACKYDWLVYGPGFDGSRDELHRALELI